MVEQMSDYNKAANSTIEEQEYEIGRRFGKTTATASFWTASRMKYTRRLQIREAKTEIEEKDK